MSDARRGGDEQLSQERDNEHEPRPRTKPKRAWLRGRWIGAWRFVTEDGVR
jgi:hypothetical protein